MNGYFKATELLKNILQSYPTNVTVRTGRFNEMDLDKKTIYPLAYITQSLRSYASSQMNSYTFEIGILIDRDNSRSVIEEKFYDNDNEIDNFNDSDNILNYLITTLRLQNNEDNFELLSVTDAQPLFLSKHNLLDGWFLTLTLSNPNDILNICN